jgi:Nitrile hydratase, alpha chain
MQSGSTAPLRSIRLCFGSRAPYHPIPAKPDNNFCKQNIERKRTVKHEEQMRIIENIVARAWTDDIFKCRLVSDPAGVLKAEGVRIPQGVEVRILEDTDNVLHVVLPMKPSGRELAEAQFKVYGRPA